MEKEAERSGFMADPAGEFPFDVATYLFHLLAQLSRHRDAELDRALKPHGLNIARHRAISAIARIGPCTMSQLADFSAVDRTTMTRTIDQLVAEGLVERETPRSDRRQVRLTLTGAGEAACRHALNVIYGLNRQLLAEIPEDAQRAVIRAKQRMMMNLLPDQTLARRVLFLERCGQGPGAD